MNAPDDPRRPDVPRPWQPRFTVATLLMVMLVFSVMAAAGSYLMRSLEADSRRAQLTFLLFTLAAPVLLLIVVSLLRQLTDWWRRRR
jgi:hypothetical protein